MSSSIGDDGNMNKYDKEEAVIYRDDNEKDCDCKF